MGIVSEGIASAFAKDETPQSGCFLGWAQASGTLWIAAVPLACTATD